MPAVLVTGGLGVIGSWVTRELIEQGTEVVTYSRRIDTTLVKDIQEKITCVIGDIQDLAKITQTIKQYGVERIVHLGALMPAAAEENPYLAYRINVDGTVNVLEAARLTGCKRVVCISSKGVYDVTQGEYGHPTYKPLDEDYPKACHFVYATTKLFTENAGLDYNRVYGLDVITLRFSSPYGIGRQVRHGVFAITSRIIESAMLGQPLNIRQGAEQQDDLIYHRDVSHSIVLACFAENLEHRIFNVGSGKGETLLHMIDILKTIFGDVPITIGPGLNPVEMTNQYYSVFNIERARRELGFSPQYDLEAGIKDYIETMRWLDIKPEVLP